jgi:hypothetical protein
MMKIIEKLTKLLFKVKDKVMFEDVDSVMRPLISHLKSYLPANETADNFNFYMFESFMLLFGANEETSSNKEIIALAKKYLLHFNTETSANIVRMAVKFLVFTVKNLRYAHTHGNHINLAFIFYNITNDKDLTKIHKYITNNATHNSLSAKFICPLTRKPIRNPGILRYEVGGDLMQPVYSYTLYELAELHRLIFFKSMDINPLDDQYIGSNNLLLEIGAINTVFYDELLALRSSALKS